MIRRCASRLIAPLFVGVFFALASQCADARTAVPRSGTVRVSRIFGWQAMQDAHMILWLGVSEPWMLTLQTPCDAPLHNPRWISMHDGHIVPNTDAIGNDEQSCRIQHIAQIPAAERLALGLRAPVGGPLELRHHHSKRAS